jgi:2-keto-4-pentenoate hydratase/2-oxohepta-3-ene-1,7-dioic acid hydratase in catechol pathway
MRLVRVGEPGRERAGVLGADGSIRRLPSSLGDIDAGFWTDGRAETTRRLLDADELNEVIEGPVRYGPPIAKPEKVVCIGLNYRDHAKETGAVIPIEPIVFMKAPNCVVGPNDEVLVPRGSVKTDWEVELGVVIGARARYLDSPEAAASVIAGYCVSHDVSEREFQTRASAVRRSIHSARGSSPLTRLPTPRRSGCDSVSTG